MASNLAPSQQKLVAQALKLSDEELKQLAKSLFTTQYPRLRVGVDFSAPVMPVRDGELYTVDHSDPISAQLNNPGIYTRHINVTVAQLMHGHPYIDVDIGKADYVHIRSVKICSTLGPGAAVGREIIATVNTAAGMITVPMTLSQALFDETAYACIEFALSNRATTCIDAQTFK